MGFIRRLFSADLRSATAAEAAGDLATAAERYALAEEFDSAVRIQFVRADRAETREQEIEALQAAFHWAPSQSDLQRRAGRRLGRALLARAQAEVVTTDRDRERVREAAAFLESAGDFKAAGEAYLSVKAYALAARAYRSGGHVDELEAALADDADESSQQGKLQSTFADYQAANNGGQRNLALDSLRKCVRLANNKAEYQRLLDTLESQLLRSGRVELAVRKGKKIVVTVSDKVTMGRDPRVSFRLRSPGVSRHHLEIDRSPHAFVVRDPGSRHGVLVDGLPLQDTMDLPTQGTLSLTDDCQCAFAIEGHVLQLSATNGIDTGNALFMGPVGTDIDLSAADVPCAIYFQDSQPTLRNPSMSMTLHGAVLERGDVQLISGDVITIGELEFEVV